MGWPAGKQRPEATRARMRAGALRRFKKWECVGCGDMAPKEHWPPPDDARCDRCRTSGAPAVLPSPFPTPPKPREPRVPEPEITVAVLVERASRPTQGELAERFQRQQAKRLHPPTIRVIDHQQPNQQLHEHPLSHDDGKEPMKTEPKKDLTTFFPLPDLGPVSAFETVPNGAPVSTPTTSSEAAYRRRRTWTLGERHDRLVEQGVPATALVVVPEAVTSRELPSDAAIVAFIRRPGVAVVTYEGGAAVVFRPGKEMVYGDDAVLAIAKAMRDE